MSNPNKAARIHLDDARAADTPGVMRYVLGFSLFFTIVAMSAVWIIPALWG